MTGSEFADGKNKKGPYNWQRSNLKEKIKSVLAPYLYDKSYSRALFTLYGLVIKECRVSFSQFFTWHYPVRSFFRTLGVLFTSLFRLVLGRSLKFSYSFNGEDRVLEALIKFRITNSGFYVDVGCNHPVFLSNSYLFYRRGWKGICIDANEKIIHKYRYYRPKDLAVCALVSDTRETRAFYHLTNDVLSTTEPGILKPHLDQGQTFQTSSMKTMLLTDILDSNHAPLRFDILSIDTEEHDFNVLKSLDFTKYIPTIIIIEVENFDPNDPLNNPVVSFLMSRNYRLEGFILTNLYFKKVY